MLQKRRPDARRELKLSLASWAQRPATQLISSYFDFSFSQTQSGHLELEQQPGWQAAVRTRGQNARLPVWKTQAELVLNLGR